LQHFFQNVTQGRELKLKMEGTTPVFRKNGSSHCSCRNGMHITTTWGREGGSHGQHWPMHYTYDGPRDITFAYVPERSILIVTAGINLVIPAISTYTD